MSARIPPVLRPEHPRRDPSPCWCRSSGSSTAATLDGVEVTGVTVRTTEVQPGDLFAALARQERARRRLRRRMPRTAGAVAIVTDAAGADLAESTPACRSSSSTTRARALGDISAWVYRTRAIEARRCCSAPPARTARRPRRTCSRRSCGSSARHRAQLHRRAAHRRPDGGQPPDHAGGQRDARAAGPDARVGGARRRDRGQRAGAHLEPGRRPGVRCRGASPTSATTTSTTTPTWRSTSGRSSPLFQPDHAKRGVVCLDTAYGASRRRRVPHPGHHDRDRRPRHPRRRRVGRVGRRGARRDAAVHRVPAHRARGPLARDPRAADRVAHGGERRAGDRHARRGGLRARGDRRRAAMPTRTAIGIQAYLPGRTERVSGDRGPSVYVDFGHSPDAFENTLGAVRKFTTGRTIMVFGADGDRDATKRHEMARVAAQGSDILVITDHHPALRGSGLDPRDPARGRGAGRGSAAGDLRGQPARGRDPARRSRWRARATRSSGPDPAIRTTATSAGVRTPYSARELARAALREAGWA